LLGAYLDALCFAPFALEQDLIVPSAELSLEAVVEGNMNNVCSSMSKYLEEPIMFGAQF